MATPIEHVRPSAGRTRWCAALLCVLVLAILVVLAFWVPGSAGAEPAEPWKPGRVLLQPKPGVSEARLQQIIAAQGGRVVGRIDAINIREIAVAPPAVPAVVKALQEHPAVKFAEPDRLVELSQTIPNDPLYGNAWHLPKIEAPSAWSVSTGEKVVVAVLDTGIDAAHPDLAAKLVTGWNAVSQNDDLSDINGHGTLVAGTVGAATDNGIGVASVGWNVLVMPIRVSERSDGASYVSDMARGLTWAADQGANVANMSYMAWPYSTVASAAQYMRNRGGVVFGSAGNDGTDAGLSPTPYVVVVSATSSNDGRTSWSNYGAYVDLAAPGNGIQTTSRGGGYSSASGTSFSSPISAAVAALVIAANNRLTPPEIEQILFDSAVDLGAEGWDPYYGWGRVDARAAVKLAWSIQVDREPPAVSFTAPLAGASVVGEVTVVVDATDNVGVARVDLYAAGRLVGTGTMSPHKFLWDSSFEAPGSVQLRAEARDAAGNVGVSTIDLMVTPPPDGERPVINSFSLTAASGGRWTRAEVGWTVSDNAALANVLVELLDAGMGTVAQESTNVSGKTASGTTSLRTRSAAELVRLTATDAAGNTAVATRNLDGGGDVGGTGVFVLSGQGTKVKGEWVANLSWSGSSSEKLRILRDGAQIAAVPNSGTYTDATNFKGGGSLTYQVCEESTRCSNAITIAF
jgi:thermitase